MEQLELQTPRLLIRNLRLDDLAAFLVYRSNPEVVKYQGFDVMNQEQAKAFIEDQQDLLFGKPGQWVQYAIVAKDEQRLIGDCAVKIESDDPTQVTIGITISHQEQKKGYAKEVMTGLLDFLFHDKDFRRVVEIVDEGNKASIALLESLSFRKEGYFLENGFYKGKWCNEYQYAMLNREWKEKGG